MDGVAGVDGMGLGGFATGVCGITRTGASAVRATARTAGSATGAAGEAAIVCSTAGRTVVVAPSTSGATGTLLTAPAATDAAVDAAGSWLTVSSAAAADPDNPAVAASAPVSTITPVTARDFRWRAPAST